MTIASVPSDERERLEVLRASGLLDTRAEERFDRITRLARDMFGVPVALVSLVDEKRQWFKSKQGLDLCETDRDVAFCAHAILGDEPLIVSDARLDERFRDNPLVVGEPGIRFYAGWPLKSPTGHRVGTLCLIDMRPRQLDPKRLPQLSDLARMAEREIATSIRGQSEPKGCPADRSGRRGRSFERLLSGLSSRPVAGVLATMVALIVMTVSVQWDRQQVSKYLAEQRSDTLEELTVLRGELESALNQRLHFVHALGAFVNAHGKVEEESFQRFAPRLQGQVTGIRSLQLQPEGVVQHVYPIAGNEAAIGHDLLADPARREQAMAAVRRREMILVGPLKLIQGGEALIARQPVFLTDEESGDQSWWGFATVLIDYPSLIRESGLASASERLQLAVRGRHSKGGKGEVFLGESEVFDADSVKLSVTLPNGTWQVAARPLEGWSRNWNGRTMFFAASTVWTLVAGGLVYFFLRLPARLRRAVVEATAALETSEARFRDAIEALPDGFVIFDRHDRLVTCNENYRRLFPISDPSIREGAKFEEIIRYGLERGEYPEVDGAQDPALDAFLQHRLAQHRQPPAALEQPLGNGKWMRVVERRMSDGGTVGFHQEISELKEKGEELAAERDRAEAANRAKSAFLATVSHEVRTPLNGVLGLLGLLRDRTLPDEERRFVETAYQSALHLLRLLNEILDLSRAEAGRLELEEVPFDVVDLMNSVENLTLPSCEEKGLALQVRIDASLPTAVLGDVGRLRQVLLNLASNAVKFTEKGEVRLEVARLPGRSQRTAEGAVRLRFEVSDTGIGIGTDEQQRIFERFTQADSSASRRYGGVGLGLAICRNLVELMGGALSIESTLGKGSCFSFELDFATAPAPRRTREGDETAPLPAQTRTGSRRVLLAEDSPTNQLVIQAMLERSGYVVDIAANGSEAVEAVQTFPYDVVLMDISMPVVDGLEATRRIRAMPEYARLPLIALTANAMAGDEARYLEAGMDDYLPKPVSRARLLQKLARWADVVVDPA